MFKLPAWWEAANPEGHPTIKWINKKMVYGVMTWKIRGRSLPSVCLSYKCIARDPIHLHSSLFPPMERASWLHITRLVLLHNDKFMLQMQSVLLERQRAALLNQSSVTLSVRWKFSWKIRSWIKEKRTKYVRGTCEVPLAKLSSKRKLFKLRYGLVLTVTLFLILWQFLLSHFHLLVTVTRQALLSLFF